MARPVQYNITNKPLENSDISCVTSPDGFPAKVFLQLN